MFLISLVWSFSYYENWFLLELMIELVYYFDRESYFCYSMLMVASTNSIDDSYSLQENISQIEMFVDPIVYVEHREYENKNRRSSPMEQCTQIMRQKYYKSNVSLDPMIKYLHTFLDKDSHLLIVWI